MHSYSYREQIIHVFVLNIDLPVEGDETYAALEEIRQIAAKYYGDDVVLVGNSTSNHDLESSFASDNIVISVLTALFCYDNTVLYIPVSRTSDIACTYYTGKYMD